jgi:hypothetical protein
MPSTRGLRKRRIYALTAATMMFVASCKEEPLPPTLSDARSTDADDARAALLLRMHAQALQASPSTRRTCILAESDAEPSTRLLRRISDQGLAIMNASRCINHEGRIVDAISGDKAVLLSLRSFAMQQPGKAQAFGMYVLGGLWCGGGAYQLEFRLGKWEVIDPSSPIVC